MKNIQFCGTEVRIRPHPYALFLFLFFCVCVIIMSFSLSCGSCVVNISFYLTLCLAGNTKICMAWSQKRVHRLGVQECLVCQQSKAQTHTRPPVFNVALPTKRFSHVHIGLVGPLPPSEGYSYLLTIIDQTMCWPDVISIIKMSITECPKTHASHWISRCGVQLDLGGHNTHPLFGMISTQTRR